MIDDASFRALVEQTRATKVFLAVWSERYPDEAKPALELAAAILCDKPIYVVLKKGAHLPEHVRTLARGVAEFTDEASLKGATKHLLGRIAQDLGIGQRPG